jgi:palmitoyl-protein thioesterase
MVMQTKLYTEDWIGLRTLDEAGKVKFVSVKGGHLRISKSDMKTYMVPYLKEENKSTTLSSISWLISSASDAIKEALGLSDYIVLTSKE